MPVMAQNGVTPYANSVFEQPWWLDIVAPNAWKELVVEDGDAVMARWPIVHKGAKAYMPKETQTLGPWFAAVEGESESQRLSRMKAAINQMIDDSGITHWDYFLAPECDYVLPFMWRGLQVAPHFTYVIDDLADIDLVESRYSKTAKKNIKRASKVVEVRTIYDPDVLVRSMRESFSAQGRSLPISEDLITLIALESIARGNGVLLAAFDENDHCHASSLFVYDEKRCYYLLSGSDPAVRTSGAQTLILRDGIRFASSHSAVFDFEGSMIEGIEKFFRQFGGHPAVFYRVSKRGPVDSAKEWAKPKVKKALHYR